jgi:hypothetical protein
MRVELRLESIGSIALFHLILMLSYYLLGVFVESSKAIGFKERALFVNQVMSILIDCWGKGIDLSIDVFGG